MLATECRTGCKAGLTQYGAGQRLTPLHGQGFGHEMRKSYSALVMSCSRMAAEPQALFPPSQATVALTTTTEGEALGVMATSVSACAGLQARRTSSGASGHAFAYASRPATSNVSA